MEGIRKYSKEWFTLQGAENNIDNIAGLKQGAEKNTPLQSSSMNTSLFLGSADEVKEKYDKLVDSEKGKRPSSTQTNVQRFGLDNIFNALDANQDGIVSQDEINDVAALSTGELDKNPDTAFTVEDLNLLYNNAMDAVNSSLRDMGNVKEFVYENGDTTKITLGKNGKPEYKTYTTHDENGNKNSVTYNLNEKTKAEVKYDSENRIVSYNYDSPDDKRDYSRTTTYNEDGSKIINSRDYTTDITSTYGSDGKLQSRDKKYNYESDGKIDATRQKSIGDCWVLSGVNALNQSEAGQKMLSDALTHNDDGSVTVKLKGVNKEYTFSAEQIISNEYQSPNKKYSSGDTDMNLFEMAIGQYRQELIESNDYTKNSRDLDKTAGSKATAEDPLNGGQIDEAIYYITGIKSSFVDIPKTDNDNSRELLEKYGTDKEKYIATVSFKDKDPEVSASIISAHAYCVTGIDEENVYLSNPHDSKAVVTYPKDKFFDNLGQLAVTDLTSMTEQEKQKLQDSIPEKYRNQYITAPKEGVQYHTIENHNSPLKNLFNTIKNKLR